MSRIKCCDYKTILPLEIQKIVLDYGLKKCNGCNYHIHTTSNYTYKCLGCRKILSWFCDICWKEIGKSLAKFCWQCHNNWYYPVCFECQKTIPRKMTKSDNQELRMDICSFGYYEKCSEHKYN